MSATCRACGRRVLWAVTEAGKRMPLDPAVNPSGIVEVVVDSDPPRVRVLRKGEESTNRRYDSHFATCPKRQGRRG